MINAVVPEEELLQIALNAYENKYEGRPDVAVSAPGRVNLIGEHTDYNDGFVLPMALPMATIVVGKKNYTDICNVFTVNTAVDSPTDINFIIPSKGPLMPGKPKWANYVKGVVANFKGFVHGFDAVIASSVPVGGGVSSSASLEVAMYTFLEVIGNEPTEDLKEKALACQKAEHEFAQMPCGIMDQFISVMGKEGHALLIDCRSMEVDLVKMDNDKVVVLLTNSNVHHELSNSEYPIRRKQCEDAAELLEKTSLRDATEKDIEVLKSKKADPDVIKRALHVVGEIKRTVEGAAALKAGDYKKFGELMIASHNSLRDNFEVSCVELDQLVAAAIQVKGVLGSRMTGAGFGGCTVTLVRKEAVNATIKQIKKKFKGAPTFYIVSASNGCHQVPLR